MSEASQDKAYSAEDGRITIQLNGQSHFLSVNRQPLTRFYPGWSPFALHVTLLPTPILRLRHETGQEAYWIFDEHFNYLACRLQDISKEKLTELVDAIAPYFQSQVKVALEALHPASLELSEKVRHLGRPLCEGLLSAWLQRFPPPGCFTVNMLPAEGLSFRSDSPPLKAAALAQLLAVAKGLAKKTMPVILSPYGGAVLRGYPVLRLPDMELTRFADPQANVVLYIGTVIPATGDDISVIYCPQQDLILTERQTGLASTIPFRLLSRIIGDPRYVEEAPRDLTVAFGGDPGGFGAFTLGSASALPGSLPTLPGKWQARANANAAANHTTQTETPLSSAAFGVPQPHQTGTSSQSSGDS
ncbi:hypothetical protein [Acetobacter sp.]|uniref:hypothetical protein n=1 Tax=Acetobacter sp. TaxID=440 RepID=UPI0039E943F4